MGTLKKAPCETFSLAIASCKLFPRVLKPMFARQISSTTSFVPEGGFSLQIF